MAVLRSLALRQPRSGQPNWRVPGRGGPWAKRVLASFDAALEAARRGEVAAPLGAPPAAAPALSLLCASVPRCIALAPYTSTVCG